MFPLFRTLSLRYLSRHWLRAWLVVASIALGVAAWIATQGLYSAVTRSLRQSASPLRGSADFHVTNSAARFVDASLGPLLQKRVGGIERVEPFILENVRVVRNPPADALLLGLQIPQDGEDRQQLADRDIEVVDLNKELLGLIALKNDFLDPLRRFGDWTPPLVQPPLLRKIALPSLARFAQVEPVLVGEQLDRDVLKGYPQFVIEAGDRRLPVIVVGKVRATGPAATVGGQAVLMRWEAAAKLLGRPGKVHRLDVVLKRDADRDEVIREADRTLTGQAKVQTPGEQDQRLGQVMKGLERGFMLCGAGALVVGLFLVYNAMSVSVVERRHDIGILRSVGATRTQVRVLFLAEALVMGLAGAVLGVPLGVGVARLALGTVQKLITEAFRQVNDPQLSLTPALLVTAGLGGLLTALVAAVVPASRAAREEPADAVRRAPPVAGIAYRLLQVGGSITLVLLGVFLIAIRRDLTQELVLQACLILVGVGVALTAAGNWLLGRTSVVDSPAGVRHRPMTAVVYGLIFVAVGCAGLILRGSLTAETGSFAAYVLIFAGALLLSPVLAASLTRLFQRLFRNALPIESRLALDNLKRTPERTGLVVAALTAGVALMVQTAGMIKSNETAFRDWINDKFQFDLLLRDRDEGTAAGQARALPSAAAAVLRREYLPPGTRLVGQTYRFPEWDAKNRRPGAGGAADSTIVFMALIDSTEHYQANAGRLGRRDLELWHRLGEAPGRAVVSENFARIQEVKVGDTIQLEGNDGPVSFEIIGVVIDYTWIRGSIWIDRQHNKSAFAADEVNAWEVYLPPGRRGEAAELRDRIQKSPLGARYALIGLTQAEMLELYLGMLRRLFGLFYTQQVVVGVVAVIGVVTSLLISVLGRTRELGLLRAVGATRGQVIHTVLAEAVLLGVIGTVLGIVIGLPLLWYLVRVIFFEEAGFLFPVCVPWLETLIIAGLAVGSATAAGMAPAIQAVRLRIADAIAYE